MQAISSDPAQITTLPSELLAATPPAAAEAVDNLSLPTNIKIGAFNIGSALADILGSGVWNRIMIADLHYPATPVSLLLALNYFLAPLAVWAGQKSDHTRWRGYRRLPWVWGGRALMALGFLMLAFVTVELAETRHPGWWGAIIVALTLVGVGSVLSGTTYTTLIYERAPHHQRGRAIGIAWTMLLLGFSLAGVLFARLLPDYSPSGLLALFLTSIVLMVGLWFFSILGEERAQPVFAITPPSPSATLLDDLRQVWAKPTTRLFFLYIGLSFMGAFAQDQILEPFGGQVFDLTTGATSRFAAFWGSTALLGSIFALVAQRRLSRFTYRRLNHYGILTLVTTFVLLAIAASSQVEVLLRPTLFLFGIGLGLWNIGTWGLMVAVSSAEKAGTYFGLWTMASLIFRGGGAVLGAIFRDVSLALTGSRPFAYGLVFALEAFVMLLALIVIGRITFADDTEPAGENVLLALAAEA